MNMQNALAAAEPFLSEFLGSPIICMEAGAEANRAISRAHPESDVISLEDMKPSASAIERAGGRSIPDFETLRETTREIAGGFMHPLPSKVATLSLIAQMVELCAENAVCVISGAKDVGIASIAKRLKDIGVSVERNSKSHAIALRFRVNSEQKAAFSAWKDAAGSVSFMDDTDREWLTKPGHFSHGRVDAGSELLVEHLPDRISGKVADLGAGWGYLANQALERGAESVDLFEASHSALEMAKQNLSKWEADRLSFHWFDVAGEKVPPRFDHVVMNPPFHTGKAVTSSLGQAFVKAAHGALRKHGRLTMVANRHLPYERLLDELFGRHELLTDRKGFKILTARKKT
jgi:16S rRNA (guanine1207-N2)-methyltransferase